MGEDHKLLTNRVATYHINVIEDIFAIATKKTTHSASQAHECLSDSALHDDAMIDDSRRIFMSFILLAVVNIMLAELHSIEPQ